MVHEGVEAAEVGGTVGAVRASVRPRDPRPRSVAAMLAWLREHGHRTRLAEGEIDVEVTGISLSTHRVQPGDLYAALPGQRAHGISYAEAALSAGAVAILTDPVGAEQLPTERRGEVPVIVVDQPRGLLGGLAAWVYDDPSAALAMIGVTGTQGKTTCTRLAEAGLRGAGVAAAVIGTNGTRVDGVEVKTALTTPEAPDLHGLFAMMRERGVTACAMEVSSHALVLGRVDGVVFDVAVFLNLGRDHLDFHHTVEDYYAAKASLFTPERAALGLVCSDDEHGRRLAAEATIPIRTFAVHDPEADWRATDLVSDAGGSTFTVQGPDGLSIPAAVPIPGEFNVVNALAAIAACASAGFDAPQVAAGLAASSGVDGRLERIEAGQDFAVIVDYAHKPDAVAAVIETVRPLTTGRVIVVLGAGGDRDTGKRPLMASIAAARADHLVLTDDNPRTEDPAAIRAELLAGIEAGSRAEVVEIGDRRNAIEAAIAQAEPGDVVLVLGKGHESGQEIHGVVHPFDDREVARDALGSGVAG